MCWEKEKKCADCDGIGLIKKKKKVEICGSCKGSGWINPSAAAAIGFPVEERSAAEIAVNSTLLSSFISYCKNCEDLIIFKGDKSDLDSLLESIRETQRIFCPRCGTMHSVLTNQRRMLG